MDRITQANKTAKVMDRIVINDLLLFLQIFRQARVVYIMGYGNRYGLSDTFHVLHGKKTFLQTNIELLVQILDYRSMVGVVMGYHFQF